MVPRWSFGDRAASAHAIYSSEPIDHNRESRSQSCPIADWIASLQRDSAWHSRPQRDSAWHARLYGATTIRASTANWLARPI